MKPIPLICDNGLFVNLAARMARDTEVAYFSTWGNAFPQSREVAPGSGIKNIERVDNPVEFMLAGRASHVIIPDLYLDDYETLARQLEIPVFGQGAGATLETDRWYLKTFLDEHGLNVGGSREVEGLDELRKILEEEKDLWIKLSVFRGDLETYHHLDWESTEPEFYRWKVRFGPFGEKVRFIVEEPIDDASEVGFDTFFRDGKWVFPCFFGPEIKDGGYAGVMIDEFPKEYRPLMNALGNYFGTNNYNDFFSNEMRVRKGDIFMTDATCRVPSPPGGVLMNSMKNFTKFVLDNQPPDFAGPAITEIVLKSEVVRDTWLRLRIPEELKPYITLHNYCEINGQTWIIPHDSKYVEFGSACGWGDLGSAKAMALEVAKAVQGEGVHFDEHVLDKAEEELEKLG